LTIISVVNKENDVDLMKKNAAFLISAQDINSADLTIAYKIISIIT
jgi:hypothetical protein